MDLPSSIDATVELLGSRDDVADRQLATAVFLALKQQGPLFVEGEPGTGKTEIAKVLASTLDAELIRLGNRWEIAEEAAQLVTAINFSAYD